MTKLTQDIDMFAGDAKTLEFTITGSDGNGQDMTGNTASWILQDEENSACNTIKLEGSISASIVSIVLAASDTNTLAGYYYHELSSAASGSPATLAIGTAKINKSSI